MGAESEVTDYFRANFFPKASKLKWTHVSKECIPNSDPDQQPVPDVLYGYDRNTSFPDHKMEGNDVLFPLFLAELKSDGPCGDGSLWVATNQCLSGSATCLNIPSHLNIPESIVFSLAMSGTEGRLYVSWKEGPKFLMLKLADFMLQRPKEHIELQQNIKNILDWEREERLCQPKRTSRWLVGRKTSKQLLLEQRRSLISSPVVAVEKGRGWVLRRIRST